MINHYLLSINEEIDKRIIQNNILQPKELYDPIRYILANGGKRIRALFVVIGAHLYNENFEVALSGAVGVEVFHNFTLLHDDIMDKADIRRGQATVHKKWNENTAILSGDAMMILAQQCINDCPMHTIQNVSRIFNKTALEVCEGQQYDVNLEQIDLRTNSISEAEYLEMIRLKTSVLIAASLQIGAIIGGASEEESQKLYEYGLKIGLAFQIQDDLLDSFGNEETFGKKIGGDIQEGKKTYLLVKAFELGTEEQRKILSNLINLKDINPNEKVATIKSIFTSLNIPMLAQQKIDNYFGEADCILSQISGSTIGQTALQELVLKLKDRNS